jgi:hypothetical protein
VVAVVETNFLHIDVECVGLANVVFGLIAALALVAECDVVFGLDAVPALVAERNVVFGWIAAPALAAEGTVAFDNWRAADSDTAGWMLHSFDQLAPLLAERAIVRPSETARLAYYIGDVAETAPSAAFDVETAIIRYQYCLLAAAVEADGNVVMHSNFAY